MRKKVLLWFWALGIFIFCGNGRVLFGNTNQVDIDPKAAILLSSNNTFEYFCSPCHGEKGAGDGRYYSIDLSPDPRNFTDAEFIKNRTDDQIFTAINEGSAAVGGSNRCPPWGRILDEKKIENMVVYIHGLSPVLEESSSETSIDMPLSGSTASSNSIRDWLLMGGAVVILVLLAVFQWRKKPFNSSIILEKK